MVEEKYGNLFVLFLADVDTPMHAVARLIPIHLTRRDLEPLAIAAIAELDSQGVATHYHCYAMERVPVPLHCLAWGQAQSAHEYFSTAEEFFLLHHGRTCISIAHGTDRMMSFCSFPSSRPIATQTNIKLLPAVSGSQAYGSSLRALSWR
jgi:hypothetical protein